MKHVTGCKVTHLPCGQTVEFERRMIRTLPGDKPYPADQIVIVAYCHTCLTVANADELDIVNGG